MTHALRLSLMHYNPFPPLQCCCRFPVEVSRYTKTSMPRLQTLFSSLGMTPYVIMNCSTFLFLIVHSNWLHYSLRRHTFIMQRLTHTIQLKTTISGNMLATSWIPMMYSSNIALFKPQHRQAAQTPTAPSFDYHFTDIFVICIATAA